MRRDCCFAFSSPPTWRQEEPVKNVVMASKNHMPEEREIGYKKPVIQKINMRDAFLYFAISLGREPTFYFFFPSVKGVEFADLWSKAGGSRGSQN